MRPGGRRNGQPGRASFGKKKRESGCGCGTGRRRLRLRFCALREHISFISYFSFGGMRISCAVLACCMALAEMQAAVTVPVVKQTVECPSSADFFQNRGKRY